MSEQPTGTAAPPGQQGRGGRKFLGLSPVGWALTLGLAVLAGGYLLYRRSKNAAAAAATTTTDTGASSAQTDFSGQLATLQTEIEDLQSSLAGGQGGSGSGGGTGGGGVPPPGPNPYPPPVPVPNPGGTGGGTGTGGKQAPPPAVTGLHPASITPTSVGLAWNKSNGATSYQVRTTYQSQVAKTPQTATGTSATVTGLTPDHTYGLHVVAIGPGGWAPEASTVAHTPKAASSTVNAAAAHTKAA